MSEPAPHCPTCGYNLTGLPEPRCPECGRRFSPAEWVDQSLLLPGPAWERREYVNVVYALPATILSFTFRPRRFLRMLRADRGLLGTVVFAGLLLPLACLICVGLQLATGYGLFVLKQWVPRNYVFSFWQDLFGNPFWKRVVAALARGGVRTTAFMATNLLAWLPALMALDLALWRDRRTFRLLAKALFYSMIWCFWAAAIMSGVGNTLLLRIDNDWYWGFLGGWSHAGAWPWICWLAAALVTFQFAILVGFARSPRCAVRAEPHAPHRRILVILVAGWLLALYLLLLDRHVHLRFHLQFITEELRDLFYSLYRWVKP